jgi:hypothetical protein
VSRHDPSDREIRLAIVGVGNCASSLHASSACFCKHPPEQLTDEEAFARLEPIFG